jgi:hypothetical protein
MKFAMPSESERFLKLAIKVMSRVASKDEQSELDKLMTATPALRDEFSHLKNDFRPDEDSAFTELYLRVLFKTATPEEVAEIRSLQQSDPERWREFVSFGSVLQVLGEGAQVPESSGDSPEPMPEAVRKRLVSRLEETQKKAQSRRK